MGWAGCGGLGWFLCSVCCLGRSGVSNACLLVALGQPREPRFDVGADARGSRHVGGLSFGVGSYLPKKPNALGKKKKKL